MSITVTNNLDGTYTVSCGDERAIIGMPRATTTDVRMSASTYPLGPFTFPPISSSDGGAVAHIIDIGDDGARGEPVTSTNDIVAALYKAGFGGVHLGQDAPRVLEFLFERPAFDRHR